jgi:hypothetical protein
MASARLSVDPGANGIMSGPGDKRSVSSIRLEKRRGTRTVTGRSAGTVWAWSTRPFCVTTSSRRGRWTLEDPKLNEPVQAVQSARTSNFGSREVATLALDGNLLTFFHWPQT